MILFPAEPFAGRVPDSAYADELQPGQETARIDFEAQLDGNLRAALRWLPPAASTLPVVFRGWMMPPETCSGLHHALADRQHLPINMPAEHRHTHFLPESFDLIREVSPRTVWISAEPASEVNLEAVTHALASFGAGRWS